MFEERTKWIKRRFGDIGEDVLGNINETKEITFPDIVKEYKIKGKTITYSIVRDIEKSAKNIAQIYIDGADEMVGNSEYEWHQNPDKIIEYIKGGEWNIYGGYIDDKLVSVTSVHIIKGHRAVQWIWGAVHPEYRGLGVWHNICEYIDLVTEKSGAELGFFSVVTTHKYSQISAEKAGFKPFGFFIGGEFMGGSDNKYYRQNVIYYSKLYGDSIKHLQKFESMQLTEKSEKLAKTVIELWKDD